MNTFFQKNLPWIAAAVVIITLFSLWWWRGGADTKLAENEQEIATTTEGISTSTPTGTSAENAEKPMPLKITLPNPLGQTVQPDSLVMGQPLPTEWKPASPGMASGTLSVIPSGRARFVPGTLQYQTELRHILSGISKVLDQLVPILKRLHDEIPKMNLK